MDRGLKSGVDLGLKVSLMMFFCAVIFGKDLLFDAAGNIEDLIFHSVHGI